MKRFSTYLIPAVLAGAMLAAVPTGAHAKFLFFGGDKVVTPSVSRASADQRALSVIPGTITNVRTVSENGHVAYLYDVSYNGRIHAVTVNGDTGQVIADRIGHARAIFPFSLF